jgi:hypothetical protein
MNEKQFSVDIHAPRHKVWETLWQDATFCDWANIIDEGMYIKGVLKEGQEVEFMSSINGYGVTSLVDKFIPNELALFKHRADTREGGVRKRDSEWTGGVERYSLTEQNGITTLTLTTDIPHEQEETSNARLPQALTRIKTLAEQSR